jgi:hypothetical protein
VVEVDPATLLRISKFSSGEPHFGTTAGNRFDDPRTPMRRRFGTHYSGLSLRVAFAETILHDEEPAGGKFQIAGAVVSSRYVVEFAGKALRLADLTDVALKRAGIDPSLTTITDYTLPQRWSVAVHKHPEAVDGILYMSRHVNTDKALVLFDRARPKLTSARYTPFIDYPSALATALAFGDLIS